MAELVIHHPVAETVEFSVKPAPRRGDLAGARIGLYWNMKAGGDAALDQMERMLGARCAGTTFRRYRGSVGFLMRHATAEDADRMAAEVDAVVGTTAD
jgi:hypothetical protein